MQAVFKRRFLFLFLKQAFNPFTKRGSKTLPMPGEHSPAAQPLKAPHPWRSVTHRKMHFPVANELGPRAGGQAGGAEARTVLPGHRAAGPAHRCSLKSPATLPVGS